LTALPPDGNVKVGEEASLVGSIAGEETVETIEKKSGGGMKLLLMFQKHLE
jgi:hypothetical protein